MPTDTYRFQVLQHAVREHELVQTFYTLRAIGIEPVLLKGWSIARHYPDPAQRYPGDIDLLIEPRDLPRAKAAVTAFIDWHTGAADRRRRTQLVPLADCPIRVLTHEENLQYTAIHMLKHGAWSPGWLEDVKVLLESRPDTFDWQLCLGGCATTQNWVKTALVLAHRLRGARIAGTPAQDHAIPAWLVPAVEKLWRHPEPEQNQPPEGIGRAMAHPWRLPRGLRRRWPDPISAAIRTGAPLDQARLKNQLAYCLHLVRNYVRRPAG